MSLRRCCKEHVTKMGVRSPTECPTCGRNLTVRDRRWVEVSTEEPKNPWGGSFRQQRRAPADRAKERGIPEHDEDVADMNAADAADVTDIMLEEPA
jgi:hypothetical protein